jgi:hypothetical protein
VNWFTIDGGGTSTGWVYVASGTIGQSDAGRMSGGSFALTGGFWGFLGGAGAVEPPWLRIRLVGTNVVLIWPNPSVGFDVQETVRLLGTTLASHRLSSATRGRWRFRRRTPLASSG